MLTTIVRVSDFGPSHWIKEEFACTRTIIEIEAVHGTRSRVGRTIPDAPEVPVIFDEVDDRGLIDYAMIYRVSLGPWRRH